VSCGNSASFDLTLMKLVLPLGNDFDNYCLRHPNDSVIRKECGEFFLPFDSSMLEPITDRYNMQ